MVGTYALFSAIADIDLSIQQKIYQLNSFLPDYEFNGFINNGNMIDADNIQKYSGIVLILLSGGTEAISKIIIENSSVPVLVLANSEVNSFAASLEIYAAFKESKNIKIFYYANLEEAKKELNKFEKISSAINKINNSKIGLFGKPSSWLLTSENIESINNFNTKLDFFGIEGITKSINSNSRGETNLIKEKILAEYDGSGIPVDDLNASANIYLSMRDLAKENELNAISIRCFDLLPYKHTACMGMSICNDENLIAGCEGDIQTTFSMMVGNYLTDKPCWMANPAQINMEENILTLAHCTVPGKMLSNKKESKLLTHMESDMSVAIQGPLFKDDVTIFRIGGDFNKIQIAAGKIVDTNMKNPQLCRTQADIELKTDISNWIKNSLGNHQVMVYGDITDLLAEFAEFAKLEIV